MVRFLSAVCTPVPKPVICFSGFSETRHSRLCCDHLFLMDMSCQVNLLREFCVWFRLFQSGFCLVQHGIAHMRNLHLSVTVGLRIYFGLGTGHDAHLLLGYYFMEVTALARNEYPDGLGTCAWYQHPEPKHGRLLTLLFFRWCDFILQTVSWWQCFPSTDRRARNFCPQYGLDWKLHPYRNLYGPSKRVILVLILLPTIDVGSWVGTTGIRFVTMYDSSTVGRVCAAFCQHLNAWNLRLHFR